MSLHDQSHSCQYGNFVGNCEKDRLDLGFIKSNFFSSNFSSSFSIKDRTYSYWNYILQNVNDFKNPLFRPQSTYASEVLLPTITSQTLKYKKKINSTKTNSFLDFG
jgi:myotubularin-related protein 6/7/8